MTDVKHKIEMDVLKVLAACAVIMIHIASAFSVKTETSGEWIWLISLIYNCSSRWAVPVFVMVSGALLLHDKRGEMPRDKVGVFYKKRLSRLLIPMVFFSLFYMAYRYCHDKASLTQLLSDVVNGRPYYHLWYLFMTAMLYFLFPLIGYFYLTFSRTAVSCVSAFLVLSALYFGGWVYDVIPYIGYFLIGRILFDDRRAYIASPAFVYLLTTGVMIASAVFNPREHLHYFNNCHILVFIQSISFYMMVINYFHLKIAWKMKWTGSVTQLASLSFGVYLIHPIVKGLFALIKNSYLTSATELTILHLEFVFVVMGSFITVYCLSKTPLKKVVGL